jgi:hypothetical protein
MAHPFLYYTRARSRGAFIYTRVPITQYPTEIGYGLRSAEASASMSPLTGDTQQFQVSATIHPVVNPAEGGLSPGGPGHVFQTFSFSTIR